MGQFEDALILAEDVFKESQDHAKPLHAVDASIAMLGALDRLGKHGTALTVIAQCEHILAALTLEPSSLLLEKKAWLLYYKALTLWRKGVFDRALEYQQRSLAHREELGQKQDIANSLFNLGAILRGKGQINKALKYFEQSLALREELSNKQDLALSLNGLGVILIDLGELDRALDVLWHFSFREYH